MQSVKWPASRGDYDRKAEHVGTRIAAFILMGLIGLFTIGFPISLLAAAARDSSADYTGLGWIIALGITAFIAFTGRVGSVWSRLCLVNGLSGFALPLVAIVVSVMVTHGLTTKVVLAHGRTEAARAGAKAGAVIGGAMVTGVAGFIGFFVGVIFLTLAFFLRERRPA